MADSQKYYDSKVKERKDGDERTWYQAIAKYKVPTGEFNRWGKPKYKYKETTERIPDDVSKRGKKAREKYAAELVDRLNALENVSPEVALSVTDSRTVDDVVVWFLNHQYHTNEIELSTFDTQMRHWQTHGQPHLGNFGFQSLTKPIIQNWLMVLHQEGLKESTIYHYYKIPRKTYQYFVDEGEIDRNPFAFRGAPKKDDKPRKSHLTPEQTQLLFSSLGEETDGDITHRLFRIITILYFSAIRRGELAGLRWSGVNLQTNQLEINTNIAVANRKTYAKLPKNQSSFRRFDMVPQLTDYLRQLHDEVQPENNWFVLTDSTDYMTPHMITKVFNDFRDKYELVDVYGNRITPHSLRHNFGYEGIQSNVDIDSLQKMFGHSRRSMTLDIYGDGSPEAMRQSSNQLGERLGEVLGE